MFKAAFLEITQYYTARIFNIDLGAACDATALPSGSYSFGNLTKYPVQNYFMERRYYPLS